MIKLLPRNIIAYLDSISLLQYSCPADNRDNRYAIIMINDVLSCA